MEIRELNEEEIDVYLELLKELDQDAILSLSQAKQLLANINSYPFYKIFVVDYNGQLAGTFTLIICDNLGHGGLKLAIVENVVVHPNFMRMGIGKYMMEEAAKVAKENNCYKLMLSSNEKRTDAHAFYDSLGFERHGISFMMELITK